MPLVLVPMLTTALVSTFGIGATAAGIAAYAIITAATLALTAGISYAMSKMAAKPKASTQQQTIKQAIPYRQKTYGRDKVAGAFAFIGSSADNVGHRVLVFGQGEWDAVEHIYMGDQQGGADMSAGTGMAPHQHNVKLEMHLGSAAQTASATMMAAFPTLWTADHRGRGLVYGVLRAYPVKTKHLQTYYPQGVSEVRIEGRGGKLYDPRTGLTAWSENAGLAIRDWLASPDGMNIDPAYLDDAAFADFADVCDLASAITGGGTEPLYTVSHTPRLDREPRATLEELLQACDGEIYPTTEGKVGIRGGEWIEPTETITEADLVDPFYEVSFGNGRSAAFNRLKVTFKHPENDYQPVELEPWQDAASQAEIGVLTGDFNAQSVTRWRQARRLAKIHMAKANPRYRLVITTTYAAALRLWGARGCRVTLPELGLDDATFWIAGAEINLATDTGRFTIQSLDASAYAWTLAEEGAAPKIAPDTSLAPTPPTPTGLALALVRVEIQSGVNQVKVRATVNAPASVWETIGRYRIQGATDWIDMTDDGDEAVISEELVDGQIYEVQAAHSGGSGSESTVIGAWTTAATITATADPTAPAVVASGTATRAGSNVTLAWTAPNSTNYAGVRLYRHTANDSSAAALIQTIYGAPSSSGAWIDAALASGSYWYWFRTINASGAASAFTASAPASITVP